MRMWMTKTEILCRAHLLGEHSEIHKHRPSFVRGHSIEGRRGQIEPSSMQARHDALAAEMLRRGYRHESPYQQPDLSAYDLTSHIVDRDAALADLLARCPECAARCAKMIISGSDYRHMSNAPRQVLTRSGVNLQAEVRP